MSQHLLEILLPAVEKSRDEDVFQKLEDAAKQLKLSFSDRKRILVVAMEMYLNLKKHGMKNRLSLLRIYDAPGGDFRISSLNFAAVSNSNRLSGKFQQLSGIADFRKNLRDKLSSKNFRDEPAGNLGLDICFRNSTQKNIRLFPVSDNLNLVFLSFSLQNHGKSAA